MDKGYKIRVLREKKGIQQKQVAFALGVTQSTYSKMEACEERISIENCQKIANIIGVTINDIVNFDDSYKFVKKDESQIINDLKLSLDLAQKEIEELRTDNRKLIRLLTL